MNPGFRTIALPIVLSAAAAWLGPTPAAAQHRNPATNDRSDAPQQAAPAPESAPQAVPRGETPSTKGDEGSGKTSGGSGRSGGDGNSTGSRPRNGQPVVGEAVPRTEPRSTGGDTTIVVPGYGYGGYGYGGYYGGYYDPYDPERSYPDPAIYPRFYEEGKLRLKIKPKNASVYIDGYYTGVVDDFDGFFQRLRIEAGPHRIEVQEPGFETLMFNVKIDPNRTTTYRGGLKKTP